MVYYKPVKVTINALAFAEVNMKTIVQYHSLPDLIVSDWGLVFSSKFWFSLCYFLKIKRTLLMAFYPQTNVQTERQNIIMEVYLWAFVKFK